MGVIRSPKIGFKIPLSLLILCPFLDLWAESTPSCLQTIGIFRKKPDEAYQEYKRLRTAADGILGLLRTPFETQGASPFPGHLAASTPAVEIFLIQSDGPDIVAMHQIEGISDWPQLRESLLAFGVGQVNFRALHKELHGLWIDSNYLLWRLIADLSLFDSLISKPDPVGVLRILERFKCALEKRKAWPKEFVQFEETAYSDGFVQAKYGTNCDYPQGLNPLFGEKVEAMRGRSFRAWVQVQRDDPEAMSFLLSRLEALGYKLIQANLGGTHTTNIIVEGRITPDSEFPPAYFDFSGNRPIARYLYDLMTTEDTFRLSYNFGYKIERIFVQP